MALVFFGTSEFAIPSLKRLLEKNEKISLVVTQPDKAKGRGRVLSSPPVKEFALAHGLRVIQPIKINDEDLYKELKSINPEFIVVVAYGKILPEEILNLPRHGCINVHASLLPKYRGAAPIQWALINGEKKTGVSTILMDKGLDTGDILLSAEVQILEEDNTETLFSSLSELGAKILHETLEGMREGKIKPIPQRGDVSYAPPLKKEDGRINWEKTSEELFNFIRGMNPWPSAFCYLNNERIKIIKVKKLNVDEIRQTDYVPGRIIKASAGELIVETLRGLLAIEELQPEGKKVMSAKAFLAGRRLKEGYEKFS